LRIVTKMRWYLPHTPGNGNSSAQQAGKGAKGGDEGGVGRAKHNKKRVLASGATVRDAAGEQRVGSVRRRNPNFDALCVVKQGAGGFEVGLARSCADHIAASLSAIDADWKDAQATAVLPKGWVCACEGCMDAHGTV
jgi:hypothetical protein